MVIYLELVESQPSSAGSESLGGRVEFFLRSLSSSEHMTWQVIIELIWTLKWVPGVCTKDIEFRSLDHLICVMKIPRIRNKADMVYGVVHIEYSSITIQLLG